MKNTIKTRQRTSQKGRRGRVVIEHGKAMMYITPRRQLQLIRLATQTLIKSGYKPDLIIGIATGGLYVPLVARALGVPYGIWMAQGYDYNQEKKTKVGKRQRGTWFSPEIAVLRRGRPPVVRGGAKPNHLCHRLLLVDDLDHTGKTFHKAVSLLRQWYGYDFDIRTLALWHKKSSTFWVDYVAEVVDKHPQTDEYPWIVQAHEEWINQLRGQVEKIRQKLK